MKKDLSLKERAFAITRPSVDERTPDRERIELDLSFLRGEITGRQYATVLDKADTQAHHTLAASLRRAHKAGLITVTIN